MGAPCSRAEVGRGEEARRRRRREAEVVVRGLRKLGMVAEEKLDGR